MFKMEILIIVLIVVFGLDFMSNALSMIYKSKRENEFDKRLWWIEQRLDDELSNDIFPDYKDGEDKWKSLNSF